MKKLGIFCILFICFFLKLIGISLAKGFPPFLQLNSYMIDSDGDKYFINGERGTLVVKIKNIGKGDAYDTKLKIEFPDDFLISIPFTVNIKADEIKKRFNLKWNRKVKTFNLDTGRINAKSEIVKKIKFIVPKGIENNKVVKVSLDAGRKYSPSPVKVALKVKSYSSNFKITFKVDDDENGDSVGNGNGVAEPRETVELFTYIKNVSKKTIRGLKIGLDAKNVDIIEGNARIDALPAGKTAKRKFVIFIPADFKDKKLKVSLNLSDSNGMEGKFATALNLKGLEYKVVTKPIQKADVVSRKRTVSLVKKRQVKKDVKKGSECVAADPNNYFFAVAVYDYEEIADLHYVKNDLNLIKKIATCYMGVPEDNFKVLVNPSKGYLKSKLRSFAKRIIRRKATFYFYYTGHGVEDSSGKFYVLPSDAIISTEEDLQDTGISIIEMKNLLSRAKGQKVAFIDACRIEPSWKPAVNVYKPKWKDIAIIFSTKSGQISNADNSGKYSAFTRALFNLVNGGGLLSLDVDGSGYVEVKEMIKPLRRWLQKVAASKKQAPDVWGVMSVPVFPVE